MNLLLRHLLLLNGLISIITLSLGDQNCAVLSKTNCFGLEFPDNRTSFVKTMQGSTERETRSEMSIWESLKAFPICWNTAKLFICHSYFHRCDNRTIYPPCKYLCTRTLTTCGEAMLFAYEPLPEWMDCGAHKTNDCNANITIPPFNGSRCQSPFLETKHKLNWYNGIHGCGLSCKSPFYSENSKRVVRHFVAIFGIISVLLTLGTLCTFLIDWKAQSRYPAVIIFYMNCCFCISTCGWLIQFLGNSREKILCREDGTLRTGEPISESGSGWCLLTFIMVYSFSVSGILWFVMLSYAWHLSFKSLGTKKDRLSGKTGYFHLCAWILPVIFTVTILGMEKVDASSLYGICFVGYHDDRMREMFLFAPAAISSVIGNFYLILGLKSLHKVWKQNPSFMNGKAAMKIKATMARIGIFAVLSMLFVWTSIICHIYEKRNKESWELSKKEYLRCLARNSPVPNPDRCTIDSKLDIGLVQLQSLSLFGASITASSWTWTKTTLKTWKRAWIRFRGFDVKKKLQLSLYRRREKRRIVPLVRQTIPSATIVVPASQALRRVSVSSRGSGRAPRSLPMRMASFISDVTNDLNSSLKAKFRGEQVGTTIKGEYFTPVVIRPREGRRGTLLSIESVLTTSSNGLRVMRRGSQQWSQASGSEYNRAFGHIYPAKAQIHATPCQQATTNDAGLTSSNLRVIRMGEDKIETYIPGMCQRNLSSESDISNSEERDSYICPEESIKMKETPSRATSVR